MRTRTMHWLPPFLLVTMAVSGCLGGDDGEPQDTDTTDTTTPSGNQTGPAGGWKVTITRAPEVANVSEAFDVQWTVERPAGAGDAPNVVAHTDFHYGQASLSSPSNQTDYGNSTPEFQAGTPGNFSANVTIPDPGDFYGRAHAIVDGVGYWSDEVPFTVAYSGEAQEVTIPSVLLGQLAGFDPAEITIGVGDTVQWKNEDDEMHTATFTAGASGTGDIPAGNTSEPIVFDTAGEFDYVCDYHPQTMQGTVIVEEAASTTRP